MLRLSVILILIISTFTSLKAQQSPIRYAIVGLTHSHVHWILGNLKTDAYEVVAIVEPNKALADRFAKQYKFPLEMVYETMDEMIQSKSPQAVLAFGTVYEHLEVVEKCAPKGIHVMVEKPLAVSLAHAKKMEALAKKNNIHLLTNYETTWYPTMHKTYEFLKANKIGELKKVIIRDGHKGPAKINLDPEFFEWLTDPVQNGGGAITDFGCYGANLMTWFMDGKKPVSVTAVTQQLQKENNPKVDDDATIILTYENSNAVLQPSWNWTIGRKDLEMYGLNGVIYADNSRHLRIKKSEGYDGFKEEKMDLKTLEKPFNDPFYFFAAVINNEVKLNPYDLSSLENNMITMKILDAAIRSAKSGKSVTLKQ
ncbi:Gfo/Idh/MocA family protein [Sphingobacterium composti Ten et al. 2007 non Yoo et al. 2007]|uniref:Gfo/Idh/MocA family protein n=1 Tax=Sphingobacterium composti TaxID=363260 RepID=UPI001357203A|nr:Gfo/Idh/MocA family oxidoreductase [Sphingobacterium composti Ten et al. 2007 non Yoo et al. 2007]